MGGERRRESLTRTCTRKEKRISADVYRILFHIGKVGRDRHTYIHRERVCEKKRERELDGVSQGASTASCTPHPWPRPTLSSLDFITNSLSTRERERERERERR